ncbi:MAG: TraR/DksA C4-type zinc finger protein [Syntrophaceae bacterium]|nr:TraR/DksA C4-type zinc finger protein [Syntrophaceae bacterium]
MMRQEKIQLIRNALVKKMGELCSRANNTICKMKNADDRYPDPFDEATVESIKFVEFACRDRERELILDIKEMIMRIDSGLFGICDHCGRVIHINRLLAEPMSKLCVVCQKEREMHKKRKSAPLAVRDISYHYV